ncbi:hypothetical protein J6590_013675 [Homalodisca vitripennis]|nr:hypothetical protein J6590_013675 [Homalodisca vitripennis]
MSPHNTQAVTATTPPPHQWLSFISGSRVLTFVLTQDLPSNLELGVRNILIMFNGGNGGKVRALQEVGGLGKNKITALQKFGAVRLHQPERAAEAMTKR